MADPKESNVVRFDWGDGTIVEARRPDYSQFPDGGPNSDPFCRTRPCDVSVYKETGKTGEVIPETVILKEAHE